MIHWSNELKRKLNDLKSKTCGIEVFNNGDRLDLGHNVDGNDVLWGNFKTPFYRIPSMVITDTGRIIVGCDYRSNPVDQSAILPCVAYSDDNGITWNKKMLDINPTNVNNNYRIMDQTMFYFKGVVHIIAGKWNGTTNNINWTQTRNDTTWSVNHYYSKDNGETWTLQENFQNVVSPSVNNSWLGAVGNAVITKQGTCVIPIQYAPSVSHVNMSFIYTNDGINFNYISNKSVNGLSESSMCQIINSSGNSEIVTFSRRDPNTGNNKAANYVVQNANGSWGNANFQAYNTYNNKIPARGTSGCQGSAISNHIGDTKYGLWQTIMVSFSENFLSGINTYTRDNIVVGIFTKTDANNSSIVLRELERIELGAGSFVDAIPYGGYSILNFNPVCKKLGIVYECMGGIKYKDLSHYIPLLTQNTMG